MTVTSELRENPPLEGKNPRCDTSCIFELSILSFFSVFHVQRSMNKTKQLYWLRTPSASCETMQESGRGPVPRSLAAAGCKDKQQEQQNDAHTYTNPEPTAAKKRLMAFGFLLHYGHLRILCCVDGLVHPGRPR